ncbi:MAG: PaaI family thioesterase [Acidiferrobacterales bacterium]|nr:PaaI family thioesterase [Acidiferrobacterales bacterium]
MSEFTVEEFNEIARTQLPLAETLGFVIEKVDQGECVVRAVFKDDHLRPGGTVSGPIMMALADFAMWGAIMSKAERVQMALTTNLNINFLLRPEPGDIVAVAKLMKLGKRLAVGSVDLYGSEQNKLVAHVTCTYSLPPSKTQQGETS